MEKTNNIKLEGIQEMTEDGRVRKFSRHKFAVHFVPDDDPVLKQFNNEAHGLTIDTPAKHLEFAHREYILEAYEAKARRHCPMLKQVISYAKWLTVDPHAKLLGWLAQRENLRAAYEGWEQKHCTKQIVVEFYPGIGVSFANQAETDEFFSTFRCVLPWIENYRDFKENGWRGM